MYLPCKTVSLIPHASKIMLKILQKRLDHFLMHELPDEQAGFEKGRGTRDYIANLRWLMEKVREKQRSLFLCFINYKKAFDCVDHCTLFNTLTEVGVPTHLIVLLRNLYSNQQATVHSEYGDTDSFSISKGVRQGCVLSPVLFNIYAELIIRKSLGRRRRRSKDRRTSCNKP